MLVTRSIQPKFHNYNSNNYNILLNNARAKAKLPLFPLFKNNAFNQSSLSSQRQNNSDPLNRPMKKPIITGRHSKEEPNKIKDSIPNPFEGQALPFRKKYILENEIEESLAKGKYWSPFIDRTGEHMDFELMARGWGNVDLYRFPAYKQPYDDITGDNDMDFQFRIRNLALHIEMVPFIPHLAPLLPELKSEFDEVCKKWQDIVNEVLNDGKSDPLRTNIIEDANDSTHKPKDVTLSEDEQRRMLAKKQLEVETIAHFIDEKVDEREYVRIIFIDAEGTKHYVYGMVGETLLQCCRRHLVPIDGYCNGYDRGHVRIYGAGAWCTLCQMDISPKYFHLIPAYDYKERKSFVAMRSITPTSRLGCSIWIRPEFDGMVVNIPATLHTPYGSPYITSQPKA